MLPDFFSAPPVKLACMSISVCLGLSHLSPLSPLTSFTSHPTCMTRCIAQTCSVLEDRLESDGCPQQIFQIAFSCLSHCTVAHLTLRHMLVTIKLPLTLGLSQRCSFPDQTLVFHLPASCESEARVSGLPGKRWLQTWTMVLPLPV